MPRKVGRHYKRVKTFARGNLFLTKLRILRRQARLRRLTAPQTLYLDATEQTDNMERTVGGKKSSNELFRVQIECIYDDLSDAQTKAYEKRQREYSDFVKKFDLYTTNRAELNIDRGDLCTFVEFVANPGVMQNQGVQLTTSQIKSNGQTPPNNQILLVNNNRLGLTGYIVPTSAMTSAGNTPVSVVNVAGTNVTVTTSPLTTTLLTSKQKITSPQLTVSNQVVKTVPTPVQSPDMFGGKIIVNRPDPKPTHKRTEGLTVKPDLFSVKPTFNVGTTIVSATPKGPALTKPIPISNVTKVVTTSASLSKPDEATPPPPKKPKLSTPDPTLSIDLTEDMSQLDDTNSGKTYASLVVMARPCIRSEKEAKSPAISKEKQALDSQVRKVLLYTPQNFTEWLIQTGLLRCDHYCSIHTGDDGSKVKLKLGQYTDSNKFPFSGGYVWVSDCCPQTYISVFSGSVFEGASYPPTTTMKLIYHWACQTSIQNVLQWVSVSNVYIKNLFTNLRAVCTAAVHQHYDKLGGVGKKVQVGVVSLGFSHKENVDKKVRVDILCVMEQESKIVRIRAIEPTHEPERFVLRKFTKIFEIMPSWVDRESIILIDNTIERSVLYNMGYKSVIVNQIKDKNGEDVYPNHDVMDYLRLIVPTMFQNTLGKLSRQVIQQFLDELCWRERWGPFPSRAFDTIIKHLIEQTKISSGATLLNRLSKISSNPFKDWKYSKWRSNCLSRPSGSGGSPRTTGPPLTMGGCGGFQKIAVTASTPLIVPPPAIPPPQSSMSDLPTPVVVNQKDKPMALEAAKILLEPYFYGTLPGDEERMKRKVELSTTCVICRKMYTSNLELSDHLIRHGISTSASDTKELCKICCKVLPSLYFLQQHHTQAHSTAPAPPNSSQWCLLCNVRYRDLASLVCHMSKYHGELELPYHCQLCDYRTSIFMDMVSHVSAHSCDDSAFCPYCFQVFTFTVRGKPSSKNQYRFVYHIQRHQLPLAKKCYKCVTTCLNKTLLNEHENKAHQSFASDSRVVRYTTKSDTHMPAPLDDPVPPKNDKFKLAVGGPYKVVSFSTPLNIHPDDENAVCIECDASINDNHFMGELLCMKCDYSTCCIRAMNEHHQSTHSFPSNNMRFYRSIPFVCDSNLNCSCGFTTKDGNTMANHLVVCKKKTCYGDPKNIDPIKSIIGQGLSDSEDSSGPNLNETYVVAGPCKPGPLSSRPGYSPGPLCSRPGYRPGPSSSHRVNLNTTYTVPK